MAKTFEERLAILATELVNSGSVYRDSQALSRAHNRAVEKLTTFVEAEIAALREPMACGHPKACNKLIGYSVLGKQEVYEYRCTACEHERLAVAAALREAAEIAHNEKNGDNRVIEERILALTDRSALDAAIHDARGDERYRLLESFAISLGMPRLPADNSSLQQWIDAHDAEQVEAIIRIIRKPRIVDAMRGYVAPTNFADEIEAEIRALKLGGSK